MNRIMKFAIIAGIIAVVMFSGCIENDVSLPANTDSVQVKEIIIPTIKQYVVDDTWYRATPIDSMGHSVKIVVDWGDNTSSESDYYSSGSEIKMTHNYKKQGNYTTKIMAIDDVGVTSGWHHPRTITILSEEDAKKADEEAYYNLIKTMVVIILFIIGMHTLSRLTKQDHE